jgi:site-specific recombinase XerD
MMNPDHQDPATVTPITPSMASGGDTTLGPLVRTYTTRRRKQHTYGTESLRSVVPRLNSLARSFGRRPLDQLGRRAIERWLESLDHLTTNSRASYLASARKFTAWLNLEGYTATDACVEIAKAKRVKNIPRAQAPDRVAAMLAASIDDRERAVFWLMLGCGLRRGEVARVRWEHYDSTSANLLVFGKGETERLIPVPEEVAHALAPIRVAATGAVIRNRRTGQALTPTSIGNMMSDLMLRAGVKLAPWDGVSGHALRHTAASEVLDNSHDLRAVQAMLGHQSLTSTEIYLRRADADRIRAAMHGRHFPDGLAA